MSFFPEDRAAELRDLFFESAQELLQTLNDQGLELEKNPHETEILRGIRRSVHTLKGDSAACGFRELSQLAHDVEEVLKPEIVAISGDAVAELVLSAADVFDAMLAAYRSNLQPPDGDSLRGMIALLLHGPAVATTKTEFVPEFQWSEYDRLVMRGALNRGEKVFSIAIAIDRNAPMRAAAAHLVWNVLQEIGTVIARHPQEIPVDGSINKLEAAISTSLELVAIRQKCHIPTIVERVVVEPWSAETEPHANQPSIKAPAEAQVAAGRSNTTKLRQQRQPETFVADTTLRVDAERIDAVMNLVGELVIGKSMLQQTNVEFGKRFPKDPLKARFADLISKQAQILHILQRSVMKIRMVPVEQLFRRFPRVLRDAAKSCGKDVELLMLGEETELDKSILDQLAEPLTHLVRNAVDHGIEPPKERAALGKEATGCIKLNAYHQANHVVIEVIDDGRGMDPAMIASKAVAKGLITAEEVARFSDHQKLEFIFESGFSTSDQITALSGRGVGMDVVRNVISRLKGTIHIISTPGQGTTFRLTLPLTLAIMKSLLFSVGEQRYAVPLNAVVEITRATAEQIHTIENREVLRLREETIVLARLSRLMPAANESSTGRSFVVVVALADRKFGLVVDRLIGEDELVIKAIDDQLVATDLVSGASIMGDGTVALILNVSVLLDRAAFTGAAQAPHAMEAGAPA